MTMPTKDPRNDHFEERLAASFERAVKRAEADVIDARLAAEAVDRTRRKRGSGAAGRAVLALAAVALLGFATLWAAAGRPSPSPAPSLLAITKSEPPVAQTSSTPSPASTPYESFGSQTPVIPGGATWPPGIDGQPIYAIGGPAEEHIAATSDATPFFVSGWRLPLGGRAACDLSSTPSIPPDGIILDSCFTSRFFAGPSGGASVDFGFSETDPTFDWQALDTPGTRVLHVVLEAHTHHAGCEAAACAEAVMDRVVLTGDPQLNPALIVATPPANVISASKAISSGYDAAKPLMIGIGATPVLISATLGTAAALGDTSIADPFATWEWKVVFASSDGYQVVNIWEDAITGVSQHQDGRGGGPYTTGP